MRQIMRWASLVVLLVGASWAQAPVVSHTATKAVQAGDVFQIAATGQANATATFQFQGMPRAWPMTEAGAGRYTAEYTVRRGEDLNNKSLTVSLRLADGRVLTGVAPNNIGQAPEEKAATSTEVVVRSIEVTPKTWVRTGGTVTINVEGTPQCAVSATAAGLFNGLALTERSAGRYVGTWTVPAGNTLSVSQPTFFLRLAQNGRSTVVPINEFIGVDCVPPTILATLPFAGDDNPTGLDTLAVAFDDADGSDLDLAKSQIVIDGTNVTDRGRVQSGWISIRLNQPLATGRHQLVVTLVDKAGNASAPTTAQFSVSDAWSAMAISHNAHLRPLEPGDGLVVRFKGLPGGVATLTIGDAVKNAPMNEVRPGEYEIEYVVRRGDKMADQYAVVNFELGGRRAQVRATTPFPATVKTTTLVAPVFTAPTNGSTVQPSTALRGTATPGAKVEITIDSLAIVAGFLEMRGDTIKLTATVNADGQWATAPVTFERPALAGKTTFTIVAVTVQNDKRSAPTTIKVDR